VLRLAIAAAYSQYASLRETRAPSTLAYYEAATGLLILSDSNSLQLAALKTTKILSK
jgi:hypothetical protein